MNQDDIDVPIRVSPERWVSAPIAVIVGVTLFIVSMVFGWSVFRNEATNNTNSIKILEARITAMERKWDVLFEKVITIESNVSWMTRTMAESQSRNPRTVTPNR